MSRYKDFYNEAILRYSNLMSHQGSPRVCYLKSQLFFILHSEEPSASTQSSTVNQHRLRARNQPTVHILGPWFSAGGRVEGKRWDTWPTVETLLLVTTWGRGATGTWRDTGKRAAPTEINAVLSTRTSEHIPKAPQVGIGGTFWPLLSRLEASPNELPQWTQGTC